MSNPKKIRLGMVGCGFMGEAVHLVNFKANPDCEVVAVADPRTGLAGKVAEKYGIPAVHASHAELLAKEQVDAVVAILHPNVNAIVGRDVLEAGKDLYIEKPMTTSLADAQSMVEAARRNNRIFMVAFMKRYDPGIQKAKVIYDEFAKSGEIGAPFYVHAYDFAGSWECGYPKSIQTDEPYPSGPTTATPKWLREDLVGPYHNFNNMCSHDLNLLRYLMGSEPQVTGAELQGNTLIAHFNFAGALGTLVHGWVGSRKWVEEVAIYCEKGWIKVSPPPPLLRNVPARIEVFRGGDVNETSEIQAPWGWAFKNEADHFIECCLNRTQPVSSGEDSIADIRLLEAIFRHIQGI